MKVVLIGLLGIGAFNAGAAELKVNLNVIVVDKYVKEVDSQEFSNISVKQTLSGRFSGSLVKDTTINETSESKVNRSILIGNDEIIITEAGKPVVYPAKIKNNGKKIVVKAKDLTGFDNGLSKKMSSYGVSKSSIKVSDLECELLSTSVLECEREVKIKYKK